jgi:hypothetical protein
MKTRRCALQIRLASVETGSDPDVTQKDVDYMGCRFRITRGDYSRLLELVVQDLAKAKVKCSATLARTGNELAVNVFCRAKQK